VRRTGATRLALRIVAGTGRSGAVRTGVLIASMAIAVAAGLVVAFVPAMATHREDVASARSIRPVVPPSEEQFRAQPLDVAVGDRPLRRTFIAADPSDPVPPGIGTLPGPGEAYVSPELLELMQREPFVASLVPGNVAGTVSAAGLTDPDELFAYIGADEHADLAPAAGYGGRGVVEGSGSGLIAVQLTLFVLVPAAGFLIVAATLSSRARSRRWDAMRSVSVPVPVVRHVAGIETGLTGLVGGVLGLALFTLVRRPLTQGGIGGLRWFPADLRLTPSVAGCTLVLVGGAGAALGRRASRIRAADTMHPGRSRLPAGLRWLPLVCGVAMLATIGVVHRAGNVVSSAPLFLTGSLLATAGLALRLAPLVRSTGRVVATRSRDLGWRLGGSRAAFEPRSVIRVLAGLVALTIVSHVMFAVLADLRLVVGDQRHRVLADVEVTGLADADVQRVLDLGPRSVAFAHSTDHGPAGATIAFADCTALAALISTEAPCRAGDRYRVADPTFPSDLPSRRTYEIATSDGTPMAVTAPAAEATDLTGMFDTMTLLIASPAPIGPIVVDRVGHLVNRADLLELQAAVDAIDPGLRVDGNIEPEQIERYEHHLAIARLGATLGGLLATLTFLIASVDRLLERRSHVATLVAIGVPRRTLRTSQVAQLVLPMAAALAAANLVGWLIAQGYLAHGGLLPGSQIGQLLRGLALSAASIVLAAAVGAIVSVPKDIATHLKAE
jgi:hypothetical protein